MKILFVNNFRGRGGGEEFLRDLLPGLAEKGHEVGLVCRPNTPLQEMLQGSNVDLYPTDRAGVRGVLSVFRIARIIRERGYEIVNIQRGHDIIQSWTAAMLSRVQPLLLYTPQVADFYPSRFLLGRMDGIVTISKHIRQRLIEFSPALEQRISIIYYGIDLDRFESLPSAREGVRKRFGLPADTPLIGTVGDLWKNQIEFLDALGSIRKRHQDARFVLVASESGIGEIQAFKERAAALGLQDAVLWMGRLRKEDMPAFYGGIDVAISTHRNEGFGIWALEALAMGRPVVAYRAGGIRDALEGCPSGILIDGGAGIMADRVSALLADADERHRLGREGARWVRDRFGKQRMIEDYDRYFRSLQRR